MYEYIQSLSEYIRQHPICFDTETEVPCLEALWWHYAGFYPIHNDKCKQTQAMIREKLSKHYTADTEEMNDLIGSLCCEYEQLAFIAGMRLGIQLIQELNKT